MKKIIKKCMAIVMIIMVQMLSCAAMPMQADRTVSGYIIVAQDGTGDFTTIQAAVNACPDNGTIIVKPGVYNENVRVIGKAVHISGSGKDKCMLAYDTVNYLYVPLEIAAGSVSGMTIYGYHSRNTLSQNEIDYAIACYGKTVYDSVQNAPGYAVHVEQDCLYGRMLAFRDCRIVSENNQCVGIGSRGKSSITFTDCELINQNYAGCIFMHDSVVQKVGGRAKFSMENCVMISSCEYAIALYTYNESNSNELSFINVRAYDRNGGLLPVPIMAENHAAKAGGWAGLCNTTLVSSSRDNNIAICNY